MKPREKETKLKGPKKILAALVMIFFLATVVFRFLEGLSWYDSIYFTIVTLTTVGYGDIYPTSPLTKIVASIFIIAGTGTFLLFLGSIVEIFVGEKLEEVLAMERIGTINDHVILCGYGRVGKIIAAELREMKRDFIIIEKNEEKVKNIMENFDYYVIQDDARREEVLEKAMIYDSKALITTLAEDADNVFVIITAKALNPKLRVISTAINEDNRDKLRKIGADEVITPEVVVGKVIARSLTVPSITSLFDRLELTSRQDACKLALKPEHAGKKIEDLGIDVLALVRGDKVIQKPNPKLVLKEGDRIIAVAKKEEHT